jgi:DNA-binding SARP family transcriptional activator
MLGLHNGSVVSADTLIELLWGDDPPRTADKAGLRPLPPGGAKSCRNA